MVQAVDRQQAPGADRAPQPRHHARLARLFLAPDDSPPSDAQVAAEFARRHERIRTHSQLGVGTELRVLLPLAKGT